MWKKKLVAAALGFVLALPIPAWASVQKDGVHITILHTNDMHSRVLTTDDSSKSVGMGWLAGAMKAQRQTEPDTLVLDAGDTFHGMPIVNLSLGENMVLLMNLAGYDATTPGKSFPCLAPMCWIRTASAPSLSHIPAMSSMG